VLTRAHMLRCQGVALPPAVLRLTPLPHNELELRLHPEEASA
jgi:hypothetical protein